MRAWLLMLALLLGFVSPAHRQFVLAQTPAGVVDLQTMLEKGLKVRRPEEEQFIKRVVREVKRGTLSEPLVKAVFQAARNRSEQYPFFYFREMMIRLAAQRGVRLD